MAAINKRLGALARAIQPARPLVVVYGMGGEYWRAGEIDPRAAIDPAHKGNQRLTAGELAQLERRAQVLLVRYVDNWQEVQA